MNLIVFEITIREWIHSMTNDLFLNINYKKNKKSLFSMTLFKAL